MSDKLFSQRTAAAYLTENGYRIHESELSKMGSYGIGPKYQRLGQQKIFMQMDLDHWLINQKDERDINETSEAKRSA